MSLMKNAIENHKAIRRTYMVVWLLFSFAVIWAGLRYFTELTTAQVSFITVVLGLNQVPVAFYFMQRGRDQ